MSRLSRTHYRPLLSIVNNKPHASSDDHEEPLQPPKISVHSIPKATDTTVPLAGALERTEKKNRLSLPLQSTRTSPRKRKDPELIDLSDSSSPKKQKLNAAIPLSRKSQSAAEKSLPSPESAQSLGSTKRRNARMRTETDFDADPLSSSEAEQPSTVGGVQTYGGGSTTSTRKSGVHSTKSQAGVKPGDRTGTKRTATSAGAAKEASKMSISGFKTTEKLNLISSRNNDTLPKKFKKNASVPKTVSDNELDESDDGFGNIFAEPASKRRKPGSSGSRSSQQAAYGKRVQTARKIQATKYRKAPEAPKPVVPSEARFKRHDLGYDFSSQSTNAVTSSALVGDCLVDDHDTSLSTSRPEEEEENIVLDGVTMITCSICSALVEKMLREEYEDTTMRDKGSYKWQQGFCTWHKKQTAVETWKKRGYPEIDWDQMKQRMRRYDKFISDVLNSRVESYHRKKLHDNSQQGRKRQKDIITEGTSKFTMGYYGPKGERRVHEHIMTRFADDLRRQVIKDKLMHASGMQGGVNGFVQLVLAPHLAELLVKEDLNLLEDNWEARARDVLAESTEVGELLWPEEQEKVGEGACEDHITEDESDEDLRLLKDYDDDAEAEAEVVELD